MSCIIQKSNYSSIKKRGGMKLQVVKIRLHILYLDFGQGYSTIFQDMNGSMKVLRGTAQSQAESKGDMCDTLHYFSHRMAGTNLSSHQLRRLKKRTQQSKHESTCPCCSGQQGHVDMQVHVHFLTLKIETALSSKTLEPTSQCYGNFLKFY